MWWLQLLFSQKKNIYLKTISKKTTTIIPDDPLLLNY